MVKRYRLLTASYLENKDCIYHGKKMINLVLMSFFTRFSAITNIKKDNKNKCRPTS